MKNSTRIPMTIRLKIVRFLESKKAEMLTWSFGDIHAAIKKEFDVSFNKSSLRNLLIEGEFQYSSQALAGKPISSWNRGKKALLSQHDDAPILALGLLTVMRMIDAKAHPLVQAKLATIVNRDAELKPDA